jgi:hypothetical protein
MKIYMGINSVKAEPMKMSEYTVRQGIEIPEWQQDDAEGYLIRHSTGDESWVTREMFLCTYRPVDMMCFSGALFCLKRGMKVAREGWNGKGMFIFKVPGSRFAVNRPPLLGIYPEGTEIDYQDHIDMKTADGTIVPWLCSQSDMMADDWMIIE